MASEIIYQDQTPIKGTIMAMAPPGNKTGFYYIPVANLPWQTSWQQLKDHVRSVCPVERAEVHDMTGGHVVLKGRDNFDAALRLLNGGIFKGRALIADGRNTDHWVTIKQRLDSQGTSPRLSRVPELANQPMQYGTSPLSPVASSSNSWVVTSPGPSSMGPVMDSSPDYPTVNPPYDYRATTALYSTMYGSSGASTSATSSGVTYSTTSINTHYYDARHQTSAHGCSYDEQQTCYHDSSYGGSAPSEGSRRGGDAGQVSTKKRKIILRQLPSRVTRDQVLDLIHYETGRVAEEVELRGPLTPEDTKKNRGCALITFATESMANEMINKLSGYQYAGRILEATHTKEGVSDSERSYRPRSGGSSHHHSQHSHPKHRSEKDRKGKEKEKHVKPSGSSEKKSKSSSSSSSSKSEVVIANGSSSKH
ncbi:hypothetical protein GGR57DRAFT_34132 [Xylariaceae sp. FL1272]|nr:hypothetical protein GGR57DRAFT_34132 [Xylariaceae sp. FL1272]